MEFNIRSLEEAKREVEAVLMAESKRREIPELRGFTPNASCPTLTTDERFMLFEYMRMAPDFRREMLEWYASREYKSDALLHAMKWLFTS